MVDGTDASRPLGRIIRHLLLLALVALLIIISKLIWQPRDVTISIDGQALIYHTDHVTTGAILRAAGVKLDRSDLVTPGLRDHSGADTIEVKRTVPVSIIADGRSCERRTMASTVAQALAESGIRLRGGDLVLRDGASVEAQSPLREGDAAAYTSVVAGRPHQADAQPEPDGEVPPRPRAAVRLEVTRAVPIFIHEGKEAPNEVATTAATVGEAIAQAGIELKPDDLLTPGPETPASAGLHVYVRHSVGLEIQADGERRSVRTLHTKVWQLLTQEGLTLGPLDILEPGLDAELTEGMLVRIVRVREELEEEQEVIPFAKQLVPDAEIEIDTRRIIQEGSDGLLRSTWLVRYEDNVEVARAEQKEWMENETQDEITGYGTKIVLRDLETPEGTVTYWRKLQVYATWYEPGSCGKSKDDPGYGWTATGVRLQHGIIATDPSVFPMGTRMYVPGYGLGVAADTGGAIVGYIIDLGFAEDEPRTWGSSYVEIYLLTPVPDEIIYLLP